MEKAEWIAVELFPGWFFAFHFGQAEHAVALQVAAQVAAQRGGVQFGAAQLGDRGLERI